LTIAESTDNDGSFVWSLPTDLTPANDYTIQVQDSEIENVSALSGAFAIEEGGVGVNIYWFEIASHDEGQAGSVWRTDVVLKNLSDQEADVEIKLTGAGGGELMSTVPGNAQGVFEDVLGSMGVEGKGWLEVTSDQPLIVSGRVYNSSDAGTFGQFLEGYVEGGGLTKGESGWLLQLRQLSEWYRTNIVFTNPHTESAAVQVNLYDTAGHEMHGYRVDLNPGSVFQDIEPFRRRAGKPDLGWGFASVEVVEGTAVLVSASVVDSRTNDATTVPVVSSR
jgi:hypothetical protein